MIKWKDLPIGEFLKVKRLIQSIGTKAGELYTSPLDESQEENLSALQKDWTAFLTAAVDGDPGPISDVVTLTYKQLQETTQSFFAHSVGLDQKPSA